MNNKKALSQKEITYQLALGSMDRGDAFVECVKRVVKPVPWPTDEELHKAYPDLKKWMRLVDETLGEVIKQFKTFFTDEEIDDDNNDIYIYFEVNTRFGENWSTIMTGNDDDGGKCKAIFEHLQIISPLMVAGINAVPVLNISTNTDS